MSDEQLDEWLAKQKAQGVVMLDGKPLYPVDDPYRNQDGTRKTPARVYQEFSFKPGQILDFGPELGRTIQSFPWRYRAHFEVDEPNG